MSKQQQVKALSFEERYAQMLRNLKPLADKLGLTIEEAPTKIIGEPAE